MKRSSWLKNWWTGAAASVGRSAKRRTDESCRTATAIEACESRMLPAVTALFIPVNGELSLQCDDSDSVRVTANVSGNVVVEKSISGGAFTPVTSIGVVRATSVRAIVVLGGDEANTIDLSQVTGTVFANLTRIQVDGANGHDTLIGSPDLPDSLSGGDGHDTITGAGGNDTLIGGNGDDVIDSGIGNDSIRAGDGADSVSSGDGADTVDAGDGSDTVSGGLGNDSVFGGNGQDSITGGDGNDTLNGDGGSDTVSGGLGDDSILGGELADILAGDNGNDTINGQAGDDTITGGNGQDSLLGAAGRDSLGAGDGDDTLNGGLDHDILIGNNGDDSLLGGSGNDNLFGDGLDGLADETGNDVIQGQGGQDSISGGRGRDTLNGGDGLDEVASFFVSGSTVEPPPPPAPPQPPPPPPVAGGQFPDAVDSGLGINTGSQIATLRVGVGDGSLSIDVSATGSFNNSVYDPIGAVPAADTTTSEDLYIRQGVNGGTGVRSTVQSLATNASSIRLNNTQEANSTFSIGSLQIALTQTVGPTVDNTGATSGALFTQTYRITNSSAANSDFELVRFLDADLFFDGSLIDGGGHFTTSAGDEITFETDRGGGGTTATTFVGLTSKGGTIPATNRFEIDQYSGLRTRVQQGLVLDDMVQGDGNGDDFIDSGNEYDVGMSLRNVFSVAPGATVVFTGHMIFGSGIPTAVTPPNIAPVATSNAAVSANNSPVTIDVVSDDSDADGALDYSTVRIESQPRNGTVLNQRNGLITYTPNPGFTGTDTFTYSIADNLGLRSNSATITITVLGVDNIGDSLIGGNDDDTLIGNLGNDTINGSGGNDLIRGGGGFDQLFGGSGADTLLGEDGDDTLDGQGGADSLDGGNGEDFYVWSGAASGFDTLYGTEGSDTASIQGTGAADAIAVGEVDSLMTVTFGGATLLLSDSAERPSTIVNVVINGLGGNDTLTIGNVNNVGRLQLVMNGGDGNDLIDATGASLGSVRAALNGNNGNDTVNGSVSGDTIDGGAGDDLLGGLAGNDTLIGGLGNDSLGGGAGNDSLAGGDGNDLLNGQKGDDSVLGGLGQDTLNGEDGNDSLFGELGNDNLNGGAGNDSLEGASGADALIGGAGNDTLSGGRNDDTLSGNGGDDKLRGDHGHDYIAAGDGSDTVNGGDGNDTIVTLDGNDFVAGGDGNDRINTAGGDDIITGGDGNDSIQGGGGSDIILGGDGDDSINGQGGTDLIAGQQGNDVLDDPLLEINERYVLDAAILQILRAL